MTIDIHFKARRTALAVIGLTAASLVSPLARAQGAKVLKLGSILTVTGPNASIGKEGLAGDLDSAPEKEGRCLGHSKDLESARAEPGADPIEGRLEPARSAGDGSVRSRSFGHGGHRSRGLRFPRVSCMLRFATDN